LLATTLIEGVLLSKESLDNRVGSSFLTNFPKEQILFKIPPKSSMKSFCRSEKKL
jgi:hypothetical protein